MLVGSGPHICCLATFQFEKQSRVTKSAFASSENRVDPCSVSRTTQN